MSTQPQEDAPPPAAVRIAGQRRSEDDHPALRKVARAVIAMALRGVQPPSGDSVTSRLDDNASIVPDRKANCGQHD